MHPPDVYLLADFPLPGWQPKVVSGAPAQIQLWALAVSASRPPQIGKELEKTPGYVKVVTQCVFFYRPNRISLGISLFTHLSSDINLRPVGARVVRPLSIQVTETETLSDEISLSVCNMVQMRMSWITAISPHLGGLAWLGLSMSPEPGLGL